MFQNFFIVFIVRLAFLFSEEIVNLNTSSRCTKRITVVYYAMSKKAAVIAISQDGKFTKNDVEISDGAPAENLIPVLEVINKMNTEGWEVYANNILPPTWGGNVLIANFHAYYFLRKKKN